jgi:hypothetical protein
VIIALILIQILYVFTLPFWYLIFGLSLMVFDAGVSLSGIVLVTVEALYPLAVVLCSIFVWLKFRQWKPARLITVNLIPVLWIVAFFIAVAVAG